MDLKEILLQTYPLMSEQGIMLMSEICTLRRVRRKTVIMAQGELTEHIILVRSGIFRVGCVTRSVEDTVSFCQPGDPFTSMHTMLEGKPSIFSLQALTDSEYYEMDLQEFRRIVSITPELLRWAYRLMARQLYYIEHRYRCFANMDAYERYVQFMEHRNDLLSRVPLKYVAQYLGIKRETLSRCRHRFGEKSQEPGDQG